MSFAAALQIDANKRAPARRRTQALPKRPDIVSADLDVDASRRLLMSNYPFVDYHADRFLKPVCSHWFRTVELKQVQVFETIRPFALTPNVLLHVIVVGHQQRVVGLGGSTDEFIRHAWR